MFIHVLVRYGTEDERDHEKGKIDERHLIRCLGAYCARRPTCTVPVAGVGTTNLGVQVQITRNPHNRWTEQFVALSPVERVFHFYQNGDIRR